MADWDILHEDDEVLVVYKPANLATQSAKPTEKDLESELKNYRVGKGEDPYIGVACRAAGSSMAKSTAARHSKPFGPQFPRPPLRLVGS